MPRRKACLILSHIYRKTDAVLPRIIQSQIESSQDDNDDDDDDDSDNDDDNDDSLQDNEDDTDNSSGDKNDNVNIQLLQFVKENPSLHQKILLLQEPVQLKVLCSEIKAAGIRCTKPQIKVKNIIWIYLIELLNRNGWTFSVSHLERI